MDKDNIQEILSRVESQGLSIIPEMISKHKDTIIERTSSRELILGIDFNYRNLYQRFDQLITDLNSAIVEKVDRVKSLDELTGVSKRFYLKGSYDKNDETYHVARLIGAKTKNRKLGREIAEIGGGVYYPVNAEMIKRFIDMKVLSDEYLLSLLYSRTGGNMRVVIMGNPKL
jgi:hypothetical protein